jgi:hypothetical protein
MSSSRRAQEDMVPPTVIKVTPEMMMKIVKQNQIKKLTPAVLTFNEAGVALVKPSLTSLSIN